MAKIKKKVRVQGAPSHEIESKANISAQNKDTGLASYNADDTRPYEQRNTSAGFHGNRLGSA